MPPLGSFFSLIRSQRSRRYWRSSGTPGERCAASRSRMSSSMLARPMQGRAFRRRASSSVSPMQATCGPICSATAGLISARRSFLSQTANPSGKAWMASNRRLLKRLDLMLARIDHPTPARETRQAMQTRRYVPSVRGMATAAAAVATRPAMPARTDPNAAWRQPVIHVFACAPPMARSLRFRSRGSCDGMAEEHLTSGPRLTVWRDRGAR